MIHYLGFCGDHGTGKSSLAGAVEQTLERNGLNVRRISFADSLRKRLGTAAGRKITREKLHPLERQALQWLGEERRAQDRNFWVREFLAIAATCYDQINNGLPMVVIADDVYHVNEAFLMDQLVLVENPEDVLGPAGYSYVPASIRDTKLLLAEAHHIFGERCYRIKESAPERVNSESNRRRIAEMVMTALNHDVRVPEDRETQKGEQAA